MRLRKILSGVLSTSIMLSVIAGNVFAETSVEINETNFPDSYFRGVVSNYDRNRDGYLSSTETQSVTMINVSNKGVSSLVGIEYFLRLILCIVMVIILQVLI